MPSRFPSRLAAPRRTSWRVALLCGAVALGLAGCGRKGPLEPPPAAATQGKPASGQQSDGKASPKQGSAGQAKAASGQAKAASGQSGAATAPGQVTVDPEVASQGGTAGSGVAAEGDDDQQTRNSADGMPQVNTIPNISPIGSGRRGKPILPPHRPFILDPIL